MCILKTGITGYEYDYEQVEWPFVIEKDIDLLNSQ